MLHKRIAESGALIDRLNVAMRPDETQMEASGILRRQETKKLRLAVKCIDCLPIEL